MQFDDHTLVATVSKASAAEGGLSVDRITVVGPPASWNKREVKVTSKGKALVAFAVIGGVGARLGED